MATRGRGSKAKGKNGELELMHILRDTYGYKVRRGDCFRGESDVIGLEGVHIEVKRVERLNIYNAISQAVEEAEKKGDGSPAVFHRINRAEWLVTLRLADFMDIYGEAYK